MPLESVWITWYLTLYHDKSLDTFITNTTATTAATFDCTTVRISIHEPDRSENKKEKNVLSRLVLLCNCLQHPELRLVHFIIQPSSPARLENGFLPFFVLNRLYWKHHIMKKQMESDWALTPIRIKQPAIVLSLRHSQLKRPNIKGLCNLCTEDDVIILLC